MNKHNHDATCSGLTRLPPSASRWVVHSGEPLPARRRERWKLAHGSHPLLQQGGFAARRSLRTSTIFIPRLWSLIPVSLVVCASDVLAEKFSVLMEHFDLRRFVSACAYFLMWAFACPHYSHAYLLHISFNFLHWFFFFFCFIFFSRLHAMWVWMCVMMHKNIPLPFILPCFPFLKLKPWWKD